MSQRDETGDLEITTPCSKRWAELSGTGPKRWCEQCSLHVVDGASLTRDEAREMVEGAGDRVCMRLVRDTSGRIVHAADRPSPGLVGRALRYGLTAAAGALVACGDASEGPRTDGPASGPVDPTAEGPPERPPEILGEVCVSEEVEDATAPVEMMGTVGPRKSLVDEPGHATDADD